MPVNHVLRFAKTRWMMGKNPTHRQTLPLGGVCVNRTSMFHFSIGSVGPSSVTFIDPKVAIGYDYAIGAGNPNFASVLLPNVGGGHFDLKVEVSTANIGQKY